VLATDGSPRMLAQLRRHGDDVECRGADLTDEAALRALGRAAFDAIVCHIAIMDVAGIESMATALPTLLARAARLSSRPLRPAFNSGDVAFVAVQTDVE
jgi:hypothetical protein